MIKSLNWYPDTCECVLEEQTEDGVQIGTRAISKCAAHASVPDEDVYAVVLKENRAKNEAYSVLIGERGDDFGLHDETLNKAGIATERKFKEGVSFSWAFEGEGKDRVLKPEIIGAEITTVQKESLMSKTESAFGVVVNADEPTK